MEVKNQLLDIHPLFGRRPQLPIDVMYSTPDQPRDAVPQYVNKLHQTLREAFEDAHERISVHQE